MLKTIPEGGGGKNLRLNFQAGGVIQTKQFRMGECFFLNHLPVGSDSVCTFN